MRWARPTPAWRPALNLGVRLSCVDKAVIVLQRERYLDIVAGWRVLLIGLLAPYERAILERIKVGKRRTGFAARLAAPHDLVRVE